MPNLHKLKNTVAVVIAHGKTEMLMAQYIKSNLHLPVKIYSENNGSKSIQIENLPKVLQNNNFSSPRKFANYFSCEIEKNKIINCKIFPIMDYDFCNNNMYNSYKTGNMFNGLWLQPNIIPIWSYPNLDEVLYSCNVIKERPTYRGKGSSYQKIFPINRGELDIDQIKKFKQSIVKCNNTNLDVFLDYCLEYVQER